jgi:dsDNA-specific endonuclease/ATPase MutS2
MNFNNNPIIKINFSNSLPLPISEKVEGFFGKVGEGIENLAEKIKEKIKAYKAKKDERKKLKEEKAKEAKKEETEAEKPVEV